MEIKILVNGISQHHLLMMNIIRNTNTVKNSIEEEYDIPQNLDLLNKWTIPRIDPKVIYKFGTFERLGLKQVVKTTEETISLNKDEMILRLLSNKDLDRYKRLYKFIHIGLVQVAFKPLTLEGLPESFIAALRDGRNLDWKQSLMGIIQSSLAHGPVYFNVYPNLQLSLSDVNILDALTLNVKTHGYNYAPGSEVICVCYRIYYKPLHTLNPHCRMVDKPLDETILIESNFNRSEITTRRSIKWDEITFPDNWVIERAVPAIPKTQYKATNIVQTPEGNVHINFEHSRTSLGQRSGSRLSRSNSSYYHISPLAYEVRSPSRNSTFQIRETGKTFDESLSDTVEGLRIHPDNIVRVEADMTASEMNFDV